MTTRIAFVNGKGGVGETTCATLIAAALKDAGLAISIEDRDPQGSATTAAGIFGLPVGAGESIVIMDTAPSIAAPETLDAIRTADLVILVTTPSPLDLATTAATAQRIQAERRGETCSIHFWRLMTTLALFELLHSFCTTQFWLARKRMQLQKTLPMRFNTYL